MHSGTCLFKAAPFHLHCIWKKNKNEPAHDKTYNKICVTSEDSDQPAHPSSLIRVFTDHMCFPQPPGYLKKDKQDLLSYWVDVQADLSLLVLLCTGTNISLSSADFSKRVFNS